jgi:hypothetical protein
MAATLTNPQIGMAISGLLTSGTFPVRSASPTHQNTSTPAVGNSAGQVNRLYQAAFTVASSGSPTSIDLTTLVDIDGTTINFVNIYSIEISNDSVTTGENMTLFGGTNGLVATSTLLLYGGVDPGAMLHKFGSAGLTVDATHKIVTIAIAAGTNVTGKITILGRV